MVVVVVTTVEAAGTAWLFWMLRFLLLELPAAAPAAPAQQNTQQIIPTQIDMGRIMVRTMPAMTTPTIRPMVLLTPSSAQEGVEEEEKKRRCWWRKVRKARKMSGRRVDWGRENE